MSQDIKESDWKRFKEVREEALNRYCQRVLEQVRQIIAGAGKSYHERYGKVYGLIHERDKALARMFDGMSRSRAFLQLVAMRGEDLVADEELAKFSPELQAQLSELSAVRRRLE